MNLLLKKGRDEILILILIIILLLILILNPVT